jgi:deoxyribodipyrimidine photo-lyase
MMIQRPENIRINIFWFRRDLRLEDNTALNHALRAGLPVFTVFIFDTNVINELPPEDPRISFIYESFSSINNELRKSGSSLYVRKGDPEEIWKELLVSFDINSVYINKDYEPYSIHRDNKIEDLLSKKQIPLLRFKDHLIFEEAEILKSDKKPYTIFTPYKTRWLKKLSDIQPLIPFSPSRKDRNYLKYSSPFPSLEELGFRKSSVKVETFDLSVIKDYDKNRDYPSADKTSYLGPHLRFGTVSIRKIVMDALNENAVFLSELIWREFFMQILFNFPDVVTGNFRSKYDNILWRNSQKEFERWCNGETGYPLVDAGMRQLNATGYMHNRVRMIAAGFLCKHLLIDWRWGEAYFAQKLLDYELSSNNGNWQWAAGTGCDAAPYFRIFNPETQLQKFDRNKEYVKKWIEDYDRPGYPNPMVEHDSARERAISTYKSVIK